LTEKSRRSYRFYLKDNKDSWRERGEVADIFQSRDAALIVYVDGYYRDIWLVKRV